MDYILLLIGFALLIKGADWLVKSGSKLARSFRISTLVIGLTVVAFGTSTPELAIGIISGFQHANQVKTIRNVHGVLSTALSKAVKTNLLTHNPCDSITLPKSKSFEYTIPERDELKSIIDAIKDTELYEAILTCAILGIRRSEVMGLYWSDIDFEEKTISINRSLIYVEETHSLEIGELKTESSYRTLPAPDVLLDTLSELYKRNASNEMKQTSPLIFTNEIGKPVRPAKLTRCYKQAAAKASFPKMRLHDLRHTVVTYLIESGLSPKTVQEFVGHTDARFTLKQYAHVVNESKRKSSQVISDLYFGK